MKKFKFNKISIVAGLVFSLVLGFSGSITAHAATSPTLVGSASYSVVAHTLISCVGSPTIAHTAGVSSAGAITCAITPGTADVNTVTSAAALADETSAYGALDAGTNADANCIDPTGVANGYIFATGTDLTAATVGSGVGIYPPGVYCSGGIFNMTGNITLTGSGPWVFKAVSGLNTSSGASVTGGDACNLWWRVGSSAVLGTNTIFKGNILALASITLNTGTTLDGRAMVQTGAVTASGTSISGPICAVPPPQQGFGGPRQGTINVVKTVINDNGGTKVVSDFPLFVSGGGNKTSVISGATNNFPTNGSEAYTVSETPDSHYTQTFSGDCDINGVLNISPGNNKFCIITNNDIGAPVVPPVPPLIDVVKVPSPLALPNGPGPVTYTYTLKNIGTVPVTDITMIGDSCSPINLISGDTNTDSKLQVNETWVYKCTTTLSATHTNTVVATGWANGISAVDIASATVIVGVPIVPPIIHVTKIPSPLALFAGGGMVNYTNKVTNPGTVPLNNVRLTDDKCSPVKYISGDTNNDSKLDPTETWIYTCQANLIKTTTNTVVAQGDANGLTSRDFAIATVVVGIPRLPNTGLPPENTTMLVGILMLVSASLAIALRKKGLV